MVQICDHPRLCRTDAVAAAQASDDAAVAAALGGGADAAEEERSAPLDADAADRGPPPRGESAMAAAAAAAELVAAATCAELLEESGKLRATVQLLKQVRAPWTRPPSWGPHAVSAARGDGTPHLGVQPEPRHARHPAARPGRPGARARAACNGYVRECETRAAQGLSMLRIDGTVAKQDREERIARFQRCADIALHLSVALRRPVRPV